MYELFDDGMGNNSGCVFGRLMKFIKGTTNFWFAGLKKSFWNLCFEVAVDCGFCTLYGKLPDFPPSFLGLGR